MVNNLFIIVGLVISLVVFFLFFLIKVISRNINKKEKFLEEFKILREELLKENPDFEITTYPPVDSSGSMNGTVFEINIECKNYNMNPNLNEVLIQDEKFDKVCIVKTANPNRAAAALNYKTRNVFNEIPDNSIAVEMDEQSMTVRGFYGDNITDKKIYDAFFEYYKRFNSSVSTDNLLKENVLNDPNEDVRLNNLILYLDSEGYKMDKTFFKKLSNDNNIHIRLIALSIMQYEYSSEIITLLNNCDKNIFSELLHNLEKWKVNNKILNRLYTILCETDNTDKIVILLDYFINNKDIKSADHVVKFIDNKFELIESSYDIMIKLINYFSSLKVKKGFNWLIEYLDSDDEIKLEVINALINIDDIRAVEYLLPLTKGIQFSDIKSAARRAINHLQKNIDISDKGTLTLMELESSNLSIDESNKNGKLTLEE